MIWGVTAALQPATAAKSGSTAGGGAKTKVTSTSTTTTSTTTTSTTSTTVATEPEPEPAPALTACEQPAARVVTVADALGLHAALADALPGDRIELADGVYAGQFVITRSGTSTQRIRLCGSRAAVLRHGVVSTGRGLHLQGASYWDLSGFTVSTAKKGIMMDAGTFNVLRDLEVHATGEEAIHLRSNSTDNVVSDSSIHHTGLSDYRYGEGVYVGSAYTQWCTWTACAPDASDRNQVLRNHFSNNAAEPIDVKEGTQFGLIEANTFDGTGLLARSWVDVKGNNWLVQANAGRLSPLHGFMTEVTLEGWGTANTFVANRADVLGSGWGFSMRPGNVLSCDNVATNALLGLSNIACTATIAG